MGPGLIPRRCNQVLSLSDKKRHFRESNRVRIHAGDPGLWIIRSKRHNLECTMEYPTYWNIFRKWCIFISICMMNSYQIWYLLDPRSLIDVFFINININFFANASFHKDIYVNCMKTETCSLYLIVMHNRRQHSIFYIFLIILYFSIRKKVTCCNSIMQCNLNNSKICSVVP